MPALHIAAWYDLFQDGSLRNYMGIKAHGGSEAARNGQRLMVIVGGHAGNGPIIGQVDFGKDSAFNQDAAILRWYDYLLKGVHNGMEKREAGEDFRDGKERLAGRGRLAPGARPKHPLLPALARQRQYPNGDGALTTAVPADEPADKYTYDPANPAPTRGGPLCCDGAHQPGRRF